MTSPDREAELIVTDLITQFCPHRERKSRYAVDHSARKHRCRICMLEARTRTRQQGQREGLEQAAHLAEHHVNGPGPLRQQLAEAIRRAHQEEAP